MPLDPRPSEACPVIERWLPGLENLAFDDPVRWVYNPLSYAARNHRLYLERYGARPKEILLLGMNPGPWGMVQTGIPFGEVDAVKRWLRIDGQVDAPEKTHPSRPVKGMDCSRSEVSGRRLWGWAEARFGEPDRFFRRFLVLNYCPLAFFDADGRNITPDRLPAAQRKPLLDLCDEALREWARWYRPRHVVGVGRFAARRAEVALGGMTVTVGCITHPSPANPKANRDWSGRIESEFRAMGIEL